ncbi:forkhead-associated domain-containing protein 1-like isoform X3 [Euwallacea fornicatus]|uniref:forkhead-associated domain-containing protein 1-like isoform X3 n=1 Tax=Euwallacea fornicatus TaxID=995702 RepID=UPI0033905815
MKRGRNPIRELSIFRCLPLARQARRKVSKADFETVRKRVFRRGNPEGEDTRQIAYILNHLNSAKPKITVHEFVNLMSKFTCDNGQTMRKVLEDDLAAFRKIVTKVYENMTEDVSDVLVNEQIQTFQFYQDRRDMFNEKTTRMIREIFQLIPDFDFEKYAKDKGDFLKLVCPAPELVKVQSDYEDVQKRQEVFHRLQWLKTEEKRLAEENSRLEERLEELKRQNKKETALASIKTSIMQRKIRDLEDEELQRQEHLRELTDILDESIVRTEAFFRLKEDGDNGLAKPSEGKKRRSGNKADLDWSYLTAKIVQERDLRKMIEHENTFVDQKRSARSRQRRLNKYVIKLK